MHKMLMTIKDKLYYYFAERNWGVRREYGPYVEAHKEEHAKQPWKHWWMLIRLNWHYRVLRKTDLLYYTNKVEMKKRLPCLEGAESEVFRRQSVLSFTKDLLQYDLISFDIFDTLILRPFAKPADLFMLVGKRLKHSEFYRIRTDAEKKARELALVKKGNREVTIYDIYSIIEEQTGIPKEKGVQTEFEIELQYCYANPYMLRIFRLLQEQKKSIIIVSDMYFPYEMMKKILQKSGYTNYEKLYVSCDYGCSKSTRSLYEYVKHDYKGKRIIHIGDNRFSDIKCAEEAGISVKYYKNVHEIGRPYRADGMSELVGSAYAGIVNIHLHNGIRTYSPYYEYGFIYGGLYILGFCNWIYQKAKMESVDKILFLSRDGAIYQKVFNMFFNDIDNEYFLWSRIANTKYTLSKNREDFLKRTIRYRANGVLKVSVSNLLDSLSLIPLKEYLKHYGISEKELIVPEIVQSIEKMFIENWDLVQKSFEKEKYALKKYITSKIGKASTIAIVDVGWMGSGPRGLKYLIEEEFKLNCKVECWQSAVRSPTRTDILCELMDNEIQPYMFSIMFNRNNFDVHTKTNKGLNNIFFELFTQDTSPSFAGIDENENFIYDISEVENYGMIKEIHCGILDFCTRYYSTFSFDPVLLNISGYDAYLPYRMIIRDLKYIKKFFSSFTYGRGISGDMKNQKLETIGDILAQQGY